MQRARRAARTAVLVAVLLALSALSTGSGQCTGAGCAPADFDGEVPGPLAARAVGEEFAVGFSPGHTVFDVDDVTLEDGLRRAAGIGVGWLRVDLDWSRVEGTPGVFDWSATDRVVTAAHGAGLEVLGLLTYTPTWAGGGGTGKQPPRDPDDFAAFASVAVRRYGHAGVAAWEVWNEPNLADFWQPRPDPAAYARLVAATVAAVRQIDDDAVVLGGGLSAARDDHAAGSWSPASFVDAWLTTLRSIAPGSGGPVVGGKARGIVQLGGIDAVAVHPYTFPSAPNVVDPWNAQAQLLDLRRVLVRNGVEVRLWVTEVGAPTGRAARAVSEARQAELLRAAVSIAAADADVRGVFVYALWDRPDGSAEELQDNFGLLRRNGSAKPAWGVLEALLGDVPATRRVTGAGR